MAGLIAAINCVARVCGKIVTRSTHCKAARTSARSLSAVIGRPFPFSSRTERSPFKPTAKRSPSARAACKYRTCPTCSKSKQPFVATSFFPAARNCSLRSESSSKPTILALMCFLKIDENYALRAAKRRGKTPKQVEMGSLSNRRLAAKICGWPFLDLSQFVENEGEKDIPHFQETGDLYRGR